ncbi:hypothetical protein F5148DRAFT_558819 [Russula earlei]|uniref:Uncharacterized protein n=2 Tax=Russula earlei TaxID=71964 RepID=A0ACC0TWZ0_9AGAM|nr:hypothetical protein F5148DRAFT_121391 [Russula earlei]KAI9451038.1 hypothetical protein F5148DRAFT_558819 [Russula earlei]
MDDRMLSPRKYMFRLTTRRARSLSSSLFGLTFLACVLTVSASDMLPCPAHSKRGRFADENNDVGNVPASRRPVVVQKRPKRWIEEHHPTREAM